MKNNSPLFDQIEIMTRECIDCGLCQKECAFLNTWGSPFQIATFLDPASAEDQKKAFECSLCGLCAAVCPKGLNPVPLFLEMRKNAVREEAVDLARYKGLLNYERLGSSKRFSWYGLPKNCDSVFFPGCTLPGTRPETTFKIYDYLKKSIPDLGIVLDCCTKPSHDLGKDFFFNAMFNEMRDYLVESGIKEVLVACPNCYGVFKKYGGELSVKSIYECMAAKPLPDSQTDGKTADINKIVTIHDPCVLRFESGVHDAVRQIVSDKGIEIREMAHTRETTLCCGEGGSVGCVAPELSKNWTKMRKQEVQDQRIITYCAGCAGFLGKVTATDHIADLFFEPEKVLQGKAKLTSFPLTYLARLKLKKRFQKHVPAQLKRERPRIETNELAQKKTMGQIISFFYNRLRHHDNEKSGS